MSAKCPLCGDKASLDHMKVSCKPTINLTRPVRMVAVPDFRNWKIANKEKVG